MLTFVLAPATWGVPLPLEETESSFVTLLTVFPCCLPCTFSPPCLHRLLCCLPCRKTCSRPVDEDLRATLKAFCTGLVAALNKYYAFGSVFAEEV
jgi:hypothetical protein